MINKWQAFLFSVLLVWVSFSTQAALVLDGTRVIYPSNAKNVSVTVNHKGEYPLLMQSWIDDGDNKALPENIKVPFILTPPIARIDPEQSQVLRISYVGNSLPQDRESVFWLNVLEVPPKPKNAENQNMLHISLRTRIKLFYRPTSLNMKVENMPESVTWKKVGNTLQATNPTPYHLSITNIGLMQEEQELTKVKAQMVAPYSDMTFTIDDSAALKKAKAVKLYYINDYGAQSTLIKPIQ